MSRLARQRHPRVAVHRSGRAADRGGARRRRARDRAAYRLLCRRRWRWPGARTGSAATRARDMRQRWALSVHAGHGLDYFNVQPVAAISQIVELNIGHAIVARALFTGMAEAVREMKALMLTRAMNRPGVRHRDRAGRGVRPPPAWPGHACRMPPWPAPCSPCDASTAGSDFLPLEQHRVVAISCALRHGDSLKVWSLGDVASGEKELLERFFEGIERYSPDLVSWNGDRLRPAGAALPLPAPRRPRRTVLGAWRRGHELPLQQLPQPFSLAPPGPDGRAVRATRDGAVHHWLQSRRCWDCRASWDSPAPRSGVHGCRATEPASGATAKPMCSTHTLFSSPSSACAACLQMPPGKASANGSVRCCADPPSRITRRSWNNGTAAHRQRPDRSGR